MQDRNYYHRRPVPEEQQQHEPIEMNNSTHKTPATVCMNAAENVVKLDYNYYTQQTSQQTHTLQAEKTIKRKSNNNNNNANFHNTLADYRRSSLPGHSNFQENNNLHPFSQPNYYFTQNINNTSDKLSSAYHEASSSNPSSNNQEINNTNLQAECFDSPPIPAPTPPETETPPENNNNKVSTLRSLKNHHHNNFSQNNNNNNNNLLLLFPDSTQTPSAAVTNSSHFQHLYGNSLKPQKTGINQDQDYNVDTRVITPKNKENFRQENNNNSHSNYHNNSLFKTTLIKPTLNNNPSTTLNKIVLSGKSSNTNETVPTHKKQISVPTTITSTEMNNNSLGSRLPKLMNVTSYTVSTENEEKLLHQPMVWPKIPHSTSRDEQSLHRITQLLNHPKPEIILQAANFIQHALYNENEVSESEENARKIFIKHNAVQKLVILLDSGNGKIERAATAALRNLAYGNKNGQIAKIEIARAGGVDALIRLLKRNATNDKTREIISALLWNLSSSDRLKPAIIVDAIEALCNLAVTIACTMVNKTSLTNYESCQISVNSDENDILKQTFLEQAFALWNELPEQYGTVLSLYCNSIGCLRNISANGSDVRRQLRNHSGLIQALIFTLKAAANTPATDSREVECCICLLRNLSYRLAFEVEAAYQPIYSKNNDDSHDLDEERELLAEMSFLPPENFLEFIKHGTCYLLNCASHTPYKRKRMKRMISENFEISNDKNCRLKSTGYNEFELPKEATDPPKGISQLWHPSVVKPYLQILRDSTYPITVEAACGALQNLTAGNWVYAQAARLAVRRDKGLPLLVNLVGSHDLSIANTATQCLKNMALDFRNKHLIGKHSMEFIISRIPENIDKLGLINIPEHLLDSEFFNLQDSEKSKKFLTSLILLIRQLILKSYDNARILAKMETVDGIGRIVKISRLEYGFPEECVKAAGQCLLSIWALKKLRNELRRAGWDKYNFMAKHAFPVEDPKHTKKPENTVNKNTPILNFWKKNGSKSPGRITKDDIQHPLIFDEKNNHETPTMKVEKIYSPEKMSLASQSLSQLPDSIGASTLSFHGIGGAVYRAWSLRSRRNIQSGTAGNLNSTISKSKFNNTISGSNVISPLARQPSFMKKEVAIQEAIENQSKMEEEEMLLTHDIEKINVAMHERSENDNNVNTEDDDESELVKFGDINKLISNFEVKNEVNSSYFVNQELERPFNSADLDFNEIIPVEPEIKFPPVSDDTNKIIFQRPESRTVLSQGPYVLHQTKRDSWSMPNLEAKKIEENNHNVQIGKQPNNRINRRRSRPLPLVQNRQNSMNFGQNSNTLPAAIALSKNDPVSHIRQNSEQIHYHHHHYSGNSSNNFRSPSVPVDTSNPSHYRQSSTINNTTTIHDSWV